MPPAQSLAAAPAWHPAPARMPAALTPPRWRSHELLTAGPVAEIDHDGQIYRLRRTSQGKLILTK